MKSQFTAIMIRYAKSVIRRRGYVTSDDLRRYAAKHGLEPEHKNAWGSLFRCGEFQAVGAQPSLRPEARGRLIRRWAA